MDLMEKRMILSVFLLVVLVTFIGAVLVGLGLFPKANPGLFKWLIGVGIGEIASVLAVFFWRLKEMPGRVTINLEFRERLPSEVNLEFDQCTYHVRDGANSDEKATGRITLTREPGGWQCVLPPTVIPSDYVSLQLAERNGDRWEVIWFQPLVTTKEVIPNNTSLEG